MATRPRSRFAAISTRWPTASFDLVVSAGGLSRLDRRTRSADAFWRANAPPGRRLLAVEPAPLAVSRGRGRPRRKRRRADRAIAGSGRRPGRPNARAPASPCRRRASSIRARTMRRFSSRRRRLGRSVGGPSASHGDPALRRRRRRLCRNDAQAPSTARGARCRIGDSGVLPRNGQARTLLWLAGEPEGDRRGPGRRAVPRSARPRGRRSPRRRRGCSSPSPAADRPLARGAVRLCPDARQRVPGRRFPPGRACRRDARDRRAAGVDRAFRQRRDRYLHRRGRRPRPSLRKAGARAILGRPRPTCSAAAGWKRAPRQGSTASPGGRAERSEPDQDEVEVEVAATGLNFRDVMWALSILPDEMFEDGYAGPYARARIRWAGHPGRLGGCSFEARRRGGRPRRRRLRHPCRRRCRARRAASRRRSACESAAADPRRVSDRLLRPDLLRGSPSGRMGAHSWRRGRRRPGGAADRAVARRARRSSRRARRKSARLRSPSAPSTPSTPAPAASSTR